MADYSLESSIDGVVAGVDEVGRGAWSGPVVACACIIPKVQSEPFWQDIIDSKKLSIKKREYLYAKLTDCCDFALGVVESSIIDECNILQATFLAMKQAVDGLNNDVKIVLVDGNHKLPFADINSIAVVKGDEKSLSIAAASIIAKVYRDRLMAELAKKHHVYGWEKNKGYGTKAHMQAIKDYGICEQHRKSFKPIAQAQQDCVI